MFFKKNVSFSFYVTTLCLSHLVTPCEVCGCNKMWDRYRLLARLVLNIIIWSSCLSTEGAWDVEEGLGCRRLTVQRAAVRPVHVWHPARRRAVLRRRSWDAAKYEWIQVHCWEIVQESLELRDDAPLGLWIRTLVRGVSLLLHWFDVSAELLCFFAVWTLLTCSASLFKFSCVFYYKHASLFNLQFFERYKKKHISTLKYLFDKIKKLSHKIKHLCMSWRTTWKPLRHICGFKWMPTIICQSV